MPWASFSMLGGPGGTGCDEVRFPVHGYWDSRDDSVACMCDCVKERMIFCNVIDNLVCWLGIVYNVCISHIVWLCLV